MGAFLRFSFFFHSWFCDDSYCEIHSPEETSAPPPKRWTRRLDIRGLAVVKEELRYLCIVTGNNRLSASNSLEQIVFFWTRPILWVNDSCLCSMLHAARLQLLEVAWAARFRTASAGLFTPHS
jgi:hypothetical protein